ncbi:hypothetical protein JTE90_013356 [Oedothorax gibbosus]|uniref:Uncharacterized protein n=1 Tax=Oedothorax gibbosus TaxID=931172 RepID=A0AAV6TWI2_9ARAC|nr:hypothetical protein JTE90_013356 [Oedothorax gibbosus]
MALEDETPDPTLVLAATITPRTAATTSRSPATGPDCPRRPPFAALLARGMVCCPIGCILKRNVGIYQTKGEKSRPIMVVVLIVIRNLEKDFQKSMATILDIELSKAVAVSSLKMMEQDPLPGGEEEKLTRRHIFEEDKEEVDEENCGKRKV